MKHPRANKGEDCFGICRADLLELLAQDFLRITKFGPMIYDKSGSGWIECHPRSDTVRRLIRDGVIVHSDDANEVQERCGMSAYRLAAASEAESGKVKP